MDKRFVKKTISFAIKVCLVAVGLFFSVNTAQAQYATDGTNGTNRVALADGAISGAHIQITANAQMSFNIPVNVTNAAVGTAINYASVAGGRDPFNGGVAPTPLTPFTPCPTTAFQTIRKGDNTFGLYSVNIATGNMNLIGGDPNMGSGADGVNAIGFNTIDHFIYGWRRDQNRILRIGKNGKAEFLGPSITGLPAQFNAYAGDVFNDDLYLYDQGGNTIVKIDISQNKVAATISLNGNPGSVADWAFNPVNSQLYGISKTTGEVIEINPTTGNVSVVSGIVVPHSADGFGAAYFDNDGTMYASRNDGYIYKITNVDGSGSQTVTLLTRHAPSTSNNDGARCINAPSPLPQANLAIIKQVSEATPAVGQTVTFTITVDNESGADAPNVKVTDNLPNGYSNWNVVSTSTGNNSYNISASNKLTWNIGMLTGSAPPAKLKIEATVETSGNHTNTAIVSGAIDDTDPSNNSDSAKTTPNESADLKVTKTVDNSSPNVGDQVTFTVTVTNNGPSDATNVKVADALPSGYTLVSTNPSAGSYSGGVWSVGSLADGAGATLIVKATVNASGNYKNTATADGDQDDPDPGNNTDDSTPSPNPQSDLLVTKTVDNSAPNVGDDVTFTVTVTNNGPSDATNVKVNDALPSGYTLVSSTPSVGSYSGGVWTVGSLADAASATLAVKATVNAAGNYKNTATADGDQDDPDPGNNTGGSTPSPNPSADVSVIKTLDTKGPYYVGQEVAYTITVKNNGLSDAKNVVIKDTPANLTITKVNGPNCNSLPCTISTLASGDEEIIKVTATIDAEGKFNNVAAVSSDTDDPDPDNNEDNKGNGGKSGASADVSVTKKLDTVGPFYAGQQIGYTIVVTNNGPSDATNIKVADTPDNMTIDKVSGACSTLPCTINKLASGDKATITVQATINGAGAFDNTVKVTPDENDPNPNNNTDDSGNGGTADPSADIALTKTLTSPGAYNAGETVTYSIVVSNNGPSVATNINVTDTPTNLTMTDVSGACSTLPCKINSLPSGDQATITVKGVINGKGAFSNTSTATASENDPDPSNNTGKDGDSGGLLADLSLTKILNTPGPYKDGDQVQFTIKISNAGPSKATGVLVLDMPTNLTINGVSGACSTLPCHITGMPKNSQRTLTVLATITKPGAFKNIATINAAQDDPNPDNNTDGDGDNASAKADVSVVKTLTTKGPYVDGQQVHYTIDITNAGPSDATNIKVKDTLANMTITNVTGACSTLPCTIGSLSGGSHTTINVTATIDKPGSFDNTVTATQDEDDPNPDNNTDKDGNGGTANASTDLSIIKTADDAAPSVGDQVIFTLTAANTGPSDATHVKVTDQLPTGYSFVSAAASAGSYNSGTGIWTIGNLADGSNATLDITAKVLAEGNYKNTTTITGGEDDPNPNNNNDGTTPNPSPSADVAVTKVLTTAGPYSAGQSVKYEITVTNNGPSEATGINITDTPTNLTTTSVSGACSTLPCTIASLKDGEKATIEVTETINGPGSFGNTATVSSNEDDPNSGNNTGTDGDNGGLSADVALVKKLITAGPYTDGQQVKYQITVTNNGPSKATGVLITDVPTNLTIDKVSGACSTLPCTISSLPKGKQETITVLGTIKEPGAFNNKAKAQPAEDDPDPSNNSDDSGNGGNANASANISVKKTLTTPGPYKAGQTIAYTIVVANAGPSTAKDIKLTDTPTNLLITDVSGACSLLPCTISSVPPGQPATVNVSAVIKKKGSFTNEATVKSSTDDPDLSDNQDHDSNNGGSANPSVDVSLIKTLNTTSPYKVNQKVNYTIFVSNNGPSDATNVVVSDTPTNLTITGVSGSGCKGMPCTLSSLPAGTQTAINVTAVIDKSGKFSNSATATPDESDSDPSNNTDGSGGSANALADVSIVKSLRTAGPFSAGQSVVYRLVVRNDGPSAAKEIEVVDTPTNMTISAVTGACKTLPCTIKSLESGDQKIIDVTAVITTTGRFDNKATAKSKTVDDPNLNFEYNKALSMRRAHSVKAYLLAAGVSGDQLNIKAVSFTVNAVAEQDILDKARNRRTSFKMAPDSGRITWIKQIEDLQVDLRPIPWKYSKVEPWDYVFDFRHNAVPADIHFTDGKTGFNSISNYLFYRVKLALDMHPKVTPTFIVISSGNEDLDSQRTSSLKRTLTANGLDEGDYRISVINYDGGSPQTILIDYNPEGVLIPVEQDDDQSLTDAPYPELIKKARRMLNSRDDLPLLEKEELLSAPKGINISNKSGQFGIEAKAGLSRLGSYMVEHSKVNVILKGSASPKGQLRKAAQYLDDWGISRSRIQIDSADNSGVNEDYIRFTIQKISGE